jgi:hypothetical protein
MLDLEFGHRHDDFVQITTTDRFAPLTSSVFATPQSLAENSGQTLCTRKSNKQARSTRGATTQDKTNHDNQSGEERQTKRVRLSRVFRSNGSQLQKKIKDSLEDKDADCVPLMYDLYSAIGAADSMVQLKNVILTMRQSNHWRRDRNLFCVSSIVNALDDLDIMQHSIAFFRRVLLLRLLHHRDERVAKLRDQMRMSRGKHQAVSIREVKSIVFKQLTQEIYPKRDANAEDVDICKRLRNRFFSARNWKRAVDLFDFGILALIPTGGVFRIQNQR